jgi:hypothetical protein
MKKSQSKHNGYSNNLAKLKQNVRLKRNKSVSQAINKVLSQPIRKVQEESKTKYQMPKIANLQ